VRVWRWILGIAVAAVLLVAVAALIATRLINPDRYKGAIESAVRRETGRPFVLEGHLRLAWFPWLGVRTGPARLGNPAGTAGPDLLDWRSAQVRVRLLPLILHRQLEMGRVQIVGADIHLRRGPDGGGSWDDLIARLRQTGTAAAGTSTAATPSTWGGLELESSSLDYLDQRSHQHVSLSGWRLRVGPWRAGEPLSVSTRFLLHLDTTGSRAAGSRAPAPGSPLSLPPAGVSVSLDVPRLQLRQTPLTVSARRWSLQVADAKLHGAVDATRDAAGLMTASGSLAADVPSLRALAQSLGIGLPAVADPAAFGKLTLAGSWQYRNGALTVAPLAAGLDATVLKGWIARSAGPRSTWTFALRADQVDFSRYLTQARQSKPLELPVSALRAVHARGTLELDRARIDGTTLKDVLLQVQ
jgi:AsmA protein